MRMTKKELVQEIEGDGAYIHVKIDRIGTVTGVPKGEPSQYNPATNTGGRRLIGSDTELLAALVESGQVSREEANTYRGY